MFVNLEKGFLRETNVYNCSFPFFAGYLQAIAKTVCDFAYRKLLDNSFGGKCPKNYGTRWIREK